MGIFQNINYVDKIQSGENLMYLLNDDKKFSLSSYKALQVQKEIFVPCMKIKYNNKTTLFYKIDNLISLENITRSIDSQKFLTIFDNLINCLGGIQSNGFLSCQNLDISADKIFIDIKTFEVKFIYIPSIDFMYVSYKNFENAIRFTLIDLINRSISLQSLETMYLIKALEDTDKHLSDIDVTSYINKSKNETEITENEEENKIKCAFILSSLDKDYPVDFELNKQEFTFGRKASSVDGHIGFNNAIGRVHCKISKTKNGFEIIDLNSANGTYINGNKIEPEQQYILKDGDIVSLANSDFVFTKKQGVL